MPDLVPIDVGGSSFSTVIGAAYERLKTLLGVESETCYMKYKSRSVILDERVSRRLHADTRPLLIGGPDGWQDVYYDDGSFRNEFGVVWHKAGDGHYAPTGNPLREATLIVQAVIFGVAHWWGVPNGVVGVILAIIYGLMMGAVRYVTGGLLLPIAVHIFADLVIFTLILDMAGRLS